MTIAGIAVAVVAPVAVHYLVPSAGRWELGPRLLLHAVVTVVAVASAIVVAAASDADTGFALDGDVKRLSIPACFAALAAVVGLGLARYRRELRPQLMDWVVLALLIVSGVAAVVGLSEGNERGDMAEDAGLLGLFVAAYAAGRLVDVPAALRSAHGALCALVAVAANIALLGAFVSPLPSFGLTVGAATAAYAAARGQDLLLALIGAALVGQTVLNTTVQSPLTQYIQVAGAAALVVYVLVQRRWNPPRAAFWVALVAIPVAAALVAPDVRSVWTRDYDGDDLSFAQRVYESEQVYDRIDDSASTALVGRGLGATVDLSASPDRRTLRAAGRDLPEVNDVHLLPYEILLKRGVLGLIVLLLYGIVLALVLQRAVESRKPAAIFFAAIPAMGLFDALSAGSHLFANPVAPLSLGIACAILGKRQTEAAT